MRCWAVRMPAPNVVPLYHQTMTSRNKCCLTVAQLKSATGKCRQKALLPCLQTQMPWNTAVRVGYFPLGQGLTVLPQPACVALFRGCTLRPSIRAAPFPYTTKHFAVRLKQTHCGGGIASRNRLRSVPPSDDSAVSLWVRLKKKAQHVLDFMRSYKQGVQVFASEVWLSMRLMWRVYGQGHRYSRREKLLMGQAASDLVKVLPLAALAMTVGIELSTVAILRYVPGLLPKAIHEEVLPAAQKMGMAPDHSEHRDAAVADRQRTIKTLSTMTRDMATELAAKSDKAAKHMPDILNLIDRIEDESELVSIEEIVEVAPHFRRYMTLDKLPREKLLQLAQLHVPHLAYNMVPGAILLRQLRSHVQRLRTDDKDIYFEGISTLTDDEVDAACHYRGLKRGLGTTETWRLRKRLQTWTELSLNREVPSSLLLLSTAYILRADSQVEATGGAMAVKLALLMQKARQYEQQMQELQLKLEDVNTDITRYTASVAAAGGSMTNSARAGSAVPLQNLQEQDPAAFEALALLRSKEASAVRAAFAAGLGQDSVGSGEVRESNGVMAVQVPAAAAAIHGLLSHKAPSHLEEHEIQSFLENDMENRGAEDGINFVHFIAAYEQLRRQQEEMDHLDKRREAVARLKALLDSDDIEVSTKVDRKKEVAENLNYARSTFGRTPWS